MPATDTEEIELANGSGSGITITNYEGNDLLLWRTGQGEKDMGYGVKPYVTAVLVTLELDPKAKGEPYVIVGHTTIPQQVLVEALTASPVLLGKLEKPAKAYRMAAFEEADLERVRALWPRIREDVTAWLAENEPTKNDTDEPPY